MKPLSSRERLLAVLRYQQPDYVPLLLHPFGWQPWWRPRPCGDQIEMAEAFLAFGLDAWLGVGPPVVFHPAVKVHQRIERRAEDPWPCMVKEYDTPAGVFRQEVFLTDDWVTPEWPQHKHGEPEVELLDDYNVVRYRTCPIQTEQDLEKLKYLFMPLGDEHAGAFREHAEATARHARRLGVLLYGQASAGTDAAVWLCGVGPLLEMALDRPGMFEALLDVLQARSRRNVEVLLDTPVDLVMRRGYYEGTTFWSPAMYRRFFLPRFKELADLAHQGGKFMGYTMSIGYMPLLGELLEAGHDLHFLLDPLRAGGRREDLAKAKAAWNGRISILGAINQPITLDKGTDQAVREEVYHSVRTLGPDGLGLCPVEAIHTFTPRQSLAAMIEAWRQVRQ